MKNNKADIYWKKNLKYLTILLSIWFTVSFGFGVILLDQLNEFQFFGFQILRVNQSRMAASNKVGSRLRSNATRIGQPMDACLVF